MNSLLKWMRIKCVNYVSGRVNIDALIFYISWQLSLIKLNLISCTFLFFKLIRIQYQSYFDFGMLDRNRSVKFLLIHNVKFVPSFWIIKAWNNYSQIIILYIGNIFVIKRSEVQHSNIIWRYHGYKVFFSFYVNAIIQKYKILNIKQKKKRKKKENRV